MAEKKNGVEGRGSEGRGFWGLKLKVGCPFPNREREDFERLDFGNGLDEVEKKKEKKGWRGGGRVWKTLEIEV